MSTLLLSLSQSVCAEPAFRKSVSDKLLQGFTRVSAWIPASNLSYKLACISKVSIKNDFIAEVKEVLKKFGAGVKFHNLMFFQSEIL